MLETDTVHQVNLTVADIKQIRRNLCRYRLNRDYTVEDFIQDAIVYHLEHPQKYDPSKASLVSYLTLLARSRIQKHITKQKRNELFDDDIDYYNEQPELIQLELLLINDLDTETRDVIIQHYQHGMTVNELARERGETTGQVKYRLAQGRKKIRELYNFFQPF